MRDVLAAGTCGEFAGADLLRRFDHFYAESEQIAPAASEALAAGDLDEFGRQVDRSLELADTLLGNQVPETIFLARSVRQIGAAAASAFGAGFGGAVWALGRIGQEVPEGLADRSPVVRELAAATVKSVPRLVAILNGKHREARRILLRTGDSRFEAEIDETLERVAPPRP